MPVGEFRSWAWLKIARLTGNSDYIDDAERQMDAYQTGQLRRAERQYGYRLAQLEGFYFYNALPMLPAGITQEEALYGVPKNKCDWAFRALDHCIYIWRERDRRNSRTFHTRLYSCHGDWEVFMKCVTSRDVHILRNVESWEKYHLKKMESEVDRKQYVEKVRAQSEYYDYMYKITDPDKRMSCYYEKRQKEHRRRLEKLGALMAKWYGPQDLTTAVQRKKPKVAQTTDLGRGHYAILLH